MDLAELQRAVFAAHGEGDYDRALDLIDRHERSLAGEHQPRLAFWRACLVTLDGRPNDGLAVLERALDEGIWWDPAILEGDPDLDEVRALPEWDAYRRRLLTHRDAVAAEVAAELIIERPEEPVGDPCPAVIVLHHAWGSAARTRPDWAAALDAGWVLAVAQSSQPAGTDSFVWNDYDRALVDLRAHFATLGSSGIDIEASVVGGFSQGAGVGMAAVLRGEVPARRFGVQAPTFGTVPDDITQLAARRDAGSVEGVIVVGSEDRGYETAIAAATQLRERVGRCDLEVVEGVGHAPPPDFPDRLRRWLVRWTP